MSESHSVTMFKNDALRPIAIPINGRLQPLNYKVMAGEAGRGRRTNDSNDDPSLAGIVGVPELLMPASGPASDKEAILGALPRDSSLQLSSCRILDPVWRSHAPVRGGR